MNKWYFTFAINYNTMSIYQTSEYGGRDGYDTKVDAVDAASKMLLKKIKEISKEINMKSQQIAGQISTVNAMLAELEKLNNE